MSWMLGHGLQPIDLVRPTVDQVSWSGIAHALSLLNRYTGHTDKPVSVGLHTLLVVEAAPDAIKPFALLHDAHETRTGDETTPRKRAMRAVAAELLGEQGAYTVDRVREELERRHDAVIFEAAGLSMPDEGQRSLVRQADIIALLTERRDFFGTGPRAWDVDALGLKPLPKVTRWRPPDVVADQLLDLFNRWLPALRRAPARRFA